MRVLLISHTYFPAHYRGKLRWLATQGGVELTLAALPTLGLASGRVLAFEAVPEPFAVRLLHPLAFRDHNILRLYRPWQMAALLRQVRPDIVHVEAEPHSLSLALMAGLKPHYNYRLAAFTWENIRRPGRPPTGWQEASVMRRVDWMLAGNSEAAGVLRWRGYSGPVSVVPQVGVNPVHFAEPAPLPTIYTSAGDQPRIGFVGRLVPQKGVLDLLSAFVPLAGKASLLYVGEGPLDSTLRARAKEAGVEDRVTLAGQVPYRDMPAYLKGLDVLVLPSRTTPVWKEQFGHVLAEAMLAGVAVVGSDSGAIPEVIGEAGLIFPEGDVGALRERLAFLLEHPEEQRALAEAGKRRALALYTDEAIGRETLQVYRSMVGDR